MFAHPWTGMRKPLAALLVCATAASCSSGGEPTPASDSEGTVTLTILVTESTAEYSMSPLSDGPAKFLMFLPLMDRTPDGSLEPRLAERWELSADGAEWLVHLDPDASWHDGVRVTAEDFVFTVDLMSRPSVGYMGYPDIEIEALDDSTFVWRSTSVSPEDWWLTWYPKHLLEGLDPDRFWEWEFWAAPVGNGPYRYVKHVSRTFTELEANPDYFAAPPEIERIVLKYGAPDGGAIAELMAGNVQAIPINPIETPALEGDERFRIHYSGYFAEEVWRTAIFWNHRLPLFADARVRRAATLAIDRAGLLPLLDLPPELPVSDVIVTERLVYEQPPPIPYDPEVARRLLDEAGWRDRDGDGVREKDGAELSFTALTDGKTERIAVIVQDRLADIGMRMEITSRPGLAEVWGQHMKTGDFEAALYWWSPGRDLTFGRESFLGYRNAHVIECLEAINATSDPVAIDSLYKEMWPDFQSDVPVTFLHPMVRMWATDRRLKGLSSPYRGEVDHYAGDLWWEEDS